MVERLDVVTEEKSSKEENDGHEEDIMVVDKTLALALLTNVVSQQASGAVPLRVRPVGAKVSGVGEVESLQTLH